MQIIDLGGGKGISFLSVSGFWFSTDPLLKGRALENPVYCEKKKVHIVVNFLNHNNFIMSLFGDHHPFASN